MPTAEQQESADPNSRINPENKIKATINTPTAGLCVLGLTFAALQARSRTPIVNNNVLYLM